MDSVAKVNQLKNCKKSFVLLRRVSMSGFYNQFVSISLKWKQNIYCILNSEGVLLLCEMKNKTEGGKKKVTEFF